MRDRERELIYRIHKGLPTTLILTLTLKGENGRGSVLSWILNYHGTLPDNIWMLEGGQRV